MRGVLHCATCNNQASDNFKTGEKHHVRQPPVQTKTLKDGQLLPPPTPYTSWMECAVSKFPSSEVRWSLSDDGYFADNEMIREAIVAEYVTLNKAAGIVVPQKTIDDLLDCRIPNFKG